MHRFVFTTQWKKFMLYPLDCKVSAMASEDVYPDLQSRWLKLTGGISKEVSEKWWNILKDKYSEPSRKYHTCSHIQKMFHHMDLHVNDIHDPNALSYAIFFHE